MYFHETLRNFRRSVRGFGRHAVFSDNRSNVESRIWWKRFSRSKIYFGFQDRAVRDRLRIGSIIDLSKEGEEGKYFDNRRSTRGRERRNVMRVKEEEFVSRYIFYSSYLFVLVPAKISIYMVNFREKKKYIYIYEMM